MVWFLHLFTLDMVFAALFGVHRVDHASLLLLAHSIHSTRLYYLDQVRF